MTTNSELRRMVQCYSDTHVCVVCAVHVRMHVECWQYFKRYYFEITWYCRFYVYVNPLAARYYWLTIAYDSVQCCVYWDEKRTVMASLCNARYGVHHAELWLEGALEWHYRAHRGCSARSGLHARVVRASHLPDGRLPRRTCVCRNFDGFHMCALFCIQS